MLLVMFLYLMIAAWMANGVCEKMEEKTMIDILGVSFLCLFWPIFVIYVVMHEFVCGGKV